MLVSLNLLQKLFDFSVYFSRVSERQANKLTVILSFKEFCLIPFIKGRGKNSFITFSQFTSATYRTDYSSSTGIFLVKGMIRVFRNNLQGFPFGNPA
jgi:hypothetical protein